MIDFSFIGKDGLIIQYEDIISLYGINILKFMYGKGINNKLDRMSITDILNSYFNRKIENVQSWLYTEFNIESGNEIFESSIHTVKPNNLFAYKMFDTMTKHMLKNMIIVSNTKSIHIGKHIESSFPSSILYLSDIDILDVFKKYPNSTFITSSCSNIRKCCETNIPITLTIIDDYNYIIDLFNDNTIKLLEDMDNIYLQYGSILSAGMF